MLKSYSIEMRAKELNTTLLYIAFSHQFSHNNHRKPYLNQGGSDDHSEGEPSATG